MPWAAAAAAAGAIGGALISSNAASNATDAQSAASANSIAEQQREFNTNQANEQPYLDAGKTALGQYQTAINTPTTAADVMSDPGYQFGLTQGQTALDRKTAAAGGRISGAALKASDQYATDYATTGYNAAYQRGQDRLNRLSSLAGLGQTATSASASSGQASTNAITALQTTQGNNSATGSVAQSNIWGNAGNQISAIAQKYYTPSNNGYTTGGSISSNLPDNIDVGGGWSPSDIRLKRDLRAIGVSPRGFTVYDWAWRADGSAGRGVVAQEVAERDPSAIRIGSNGFLEVDYSKV